MVLEGRFLVLVLPCLTVIMDHKQHTGGTKFAKGLSFILLVEANRNLCEAMLEVLASKAPGAQ